MHILFAEDSRALSAHIISILEAQGHTVTHVVDGRAAVESYRRQPPDLVLMDVVMPVLDGIEATRQIKALGGERWVPLVIMTGRSSEEELLAGLEAGADDYIVKPIKEAVLTARIRAMQRIALIQDSLFSILDNVYEGIITIDGKGRVASFNKAAERIFGYQAAEVIGHNVRMLMPNPHRDAHDGYLERYLNGGAPRIIGIGRKVSGLRRNGETFPMRLAVTEISRPRGHFFIGLVKDIAEEEAALARIEYLAHHDPLTGLPNRAALGDRLAALLEAERSGALLFIDLDGFKPVNDQLGHETGDLALINVARRLTARLGPEDFIGRLGGDEFVVLLPRAAAPESALQAARSLIDAISTPMDLSPELGVVTLGASIGVVMIPPGSHTQTEILTAADDAMYAAKQRGKGQAVIGTMERRP